jgi:hypothetical protein
MKLSQERYVKHSGKFLSRFVLEQNLLALSGSTWKEPGNLEGCLRKQFYETYFCVYRGDVVKDVVADIPQCFLYEDLLKKMFSSLKTTINPLSPEQLSSLCLGYTVHFGLSLYFFKR